MIKIEIEQLKKEIDEQDKEMRIMFVMLMIFMCLVAILFLFAFSHTYRLDELETAVFPPELEQSNFEAMLSTINKNCGSMFIVTRYGEDGLYVFDAGKYYPLEHCLVRP